MLHLGLATKPERKLLETELAAAVSVQRAQQVTGGALDLLGGAPGLAESSEEHAGLVGVDLARPVRIRLVEGRAKVCEHFSVEHLL
jgi:hypothetical protein